jgi:ComF family protein
MHTVAADITNTVLPSDCPLCDAPLIGLSRTGVCESCVARLGPGAASAQDVLCTRCGDALGMESARFAAAMGATECTQCRLAPPAFTRAVAFATYDHEMREMLHLLKFDGRRRMAQAILGERLAQAILQLQPGAASELLVVPVPLFVERERQRGFNQSQLLAKAALESLRRAAPVWRLRLRGDVLQRVKDTRPLYSLDPGQRRRALIGAFRIADAQAETLRGREVLLIDDIMTTGATARACSGVLLRAGAAKVWVATVARAQPEAPSAAAQHEPYDVALWSAPARTRVHEPDIGKRIRF